MLNMLFACWLQIIKIFIKYSIFSAGEFVCICLLALPQGFYLYYLEHKPFYYNNLTYHPPPINHPSALSKLASCPQTLGVTIEVFNDNLIYLNPSIIQTNYPYLQSSKCSSLGRSQTQSQAPNTWLWCHAPEISEIQGAHFCHRCQGNPSGNHQSETTTGDSGSHAF